MEKEFSDFKKAKLLILILIGYGIIFLMTDYLLQYFEASRETIKIIRFSLAIYAVIIGALTSTIFDTRISHKIFQVLLPISIAMLTISVISIGKSALLNDIDWAKLKNLPATIAGLYLLFISVIGRNGTTETN